MDIEIAAIPETIDVPDRSGITIRIPLTAAPDELLVDALQKSPQISSFCRRIETESEALIVVAKDDGLDGVDTVLTAIQSLVASTNAERAIQGMTAEELAAEATRAKRVEVDASIQEWWGQRG